MSDEIGDGVMLLFLAFHEARYNETGSRWLI